MTDRSSFDPYLQNVTFLAADGSTKVSIPIPMIDQWNDETVSICINYASQMGACAILLALVLLMTPSSKLARPSNVLHILGLLVCLVRMVLLSVYFLTPFAHFYQTWGQDWSQVPHRYVQLSEAGTVLSLLLVVVVEAALMHQAWTMVTLWPDLAKYAISALSAILTLLTVGLRLSFTVIQSRGILSNTPPRSYAWLVQANVVTNAVSICWFCAIFNLKLVIHLISNRGLLPSRRVMTPMEVLIATNGILMIVPVVFAGLEWARFINFEAGSLTLTSVIIILPLGTLTAQRMTNPKQISYLSGSSSYSSSSAAAAGDMYSRRYKSTRGSSSSAPLKASLFSTTTASSSSNATASTPQTSMLSRCEEGAVMRQAVDPVDLELRHIDGWHGLNGAHSKPEQSMKQPHN